MIVDSIIFNNVIPSIIKKYADFAMLLTLLKLPTAERENVENAHN